MASKILSIEIGTGLARVVEMDYNSKTPKIYNCFSFEIPTDVCTDGKVTVNDTFVSVFRAECSKRDITTRDVIFSVTSTRITSREARIPQVKEKKIYETIMANVSDYFPGDLTQYTIVPGEPEKYETATDKQWKLTLLAVPREIISSYFEFCEALGLNLVGLDYVGNSIYQCVKNTFLIGTNVVLKIDERNTMITYLKNGKIDFQRILTYGIEDAIETVMDSDVYGDNLSYSSAIQILCGRTCIRKYLNPEKDYQEEEDVDFNTMETRVAITESLRYLIGNIARVMDYYKSKNEGMSIDSIALVGLGADFSGLSKLLTNELNHSVKVFNNIANVSMTRTADDHFLSISTYAACIGAGLSPLNLIPAEQLKGKGKKAAGGAKKNQMRESAITMGAAVLVIGILASLAMTGSSVMKYMSAKSSLKTINKDIERMRAEGVEEVFAQFTTVGNLNNALNTIYDDTRSRNEDLVEFIEELEEKMPSSLNVLNFTATSSGVTMTMQCDSKEAAAKTLLQLRTFESIEIVSSSGLSDTDSLLGDSDDEAKVAFTIDCVYAPVAVETAVQAAQ